MKKSKNNTDNDLVTKKYLDQRLDVTKKYLDKKLEMLDSILKTLDWLAKDYRGLKDEHTARVFAS